MSTRLFARRQRTIGIAVVVALFLFVPGLVELGRLMWMEWRLDHRLATLSAQHEELLKEQQRLQSDPAYVEGLIRSTFKLARPGELVIPVEEASSSTGQTR